jgi:hypothetical protein
MPSAVMILSAASPTSTSLPWLPTMWCSILTLHGSTRCNGAGEDPHQAGLEVCALDRRLAQAGGTRPRPGLTREHLWTTVVLL